MEDIRIEFLAVCICFVLLTPYTLRAYGVPTHEGISRTILQKYENLRGDIFTSDEELAVVRGSNEEDDSGRYMQHFYDPINNRGLWGRYMSSKQWVNDAEAQGGELGYAREYFSRDDDYTWDRATFEYVYGDKVRAAEALGHVLHLIEDATVPAHVRDDAHGNIWGIGDPDSYEEYTDIFGKGAITPTGRPKGQNFSNLEQAFDVTATFTSENFFSDDTLEEFLHPSDSDLIVRGGFGYHRKYGHVVARAVREYDKKLQRFGTVFVLDDPSNTVLVSYWTSLSRHAVESGIGVIDLFFRAVEEERRTGVLKAKNLSPLKQHNKKLSSGFSLVKGIYGSSLSQEDVDELLGDSAAQVGSVGAAVEAVETIRESQVPTVVRESSGETSATVAHNSAPIAESVHSEPPIATPQSSATSTGASTSTASAPVFPPALPNYGGGGGGSSGSSAPASVPITPIALSVASPFEGEFFATTTVTVSGTTGALGIVALDAGSATTSATADGSGAWSASVVLAEGAASITISATYADGTGTASTSRSIWVDLTPPAAPSASAPLCTASLSGSFCLLATTSATVEWGSVADASYYQIFSNGASISTTTATSSTLSVTYGASSSVAVVSVDPAGNRATSTSISIFSLERPVILNEIAWAGTDTTATDEWIELKNTSAYTLDLSRVALAVNGTTFPLSGSLVPSAYYLVEKRSEATSKTHDLVADLALADTGSVVSLIHATSTTIDSSPAISTCAGWCAGSASASVGTSAQFGTLSGKLSMERTSSSDGTLSSSWQSNDTYIRASGAKATDSGATTILGTPGMQNSSGIANAGWSCGNGILTTSGGPYNPTSSNCTYYSAFISTQANRYGDVYKGTVGSAALSSGHSISKSVQSDQNDAGILTGAGSGDAYFVAMYEIRTGPAFSTELTDFRNYLRTGVGSAPHSNYVTIPWTYSP